jgi:transcriptional regulator with XRE-family HTH domain
MLDSSETLVTKPSMITGGQSRAARALLKWSREDLATAAGVSASTVKNFEAERNTIQAVATSIERALTEAGIEFIRPDNGGDGVRWRKPR